MRRGLVTFLFLVIAVSLGGCHKARTLQNFGLKAGLTEQDVEDQMGSPAKTGGHWTEYTLEDGSHLRLFFLEGEKGTTRTLSHAQLYVGEGPSLKITTVFKIEPTTKPTTLPDTNPTTAP